MNVNPYVHIFKNARDILQSGLVHDMHIQIFQSRPREKYIRPIPDEVAGFIVEGEDAKEMGSDIIDLIVH